MKRAGENPVYSMDKNNIDRNICIVENQFANIEFLTETTIARVIKFVESYDVSLLDEIVPIDTPQFKEYEKSLSDTLNYLIYRLNICRDIARKAIKEINVELNDNTNEQAR